MKKQTPSTYKKLTVLTMIIAIAIIGYNFLSVKKVEKESIEDIRNTMPILACGIDCAKLYDNQSEEYKKCVAGCTPKQEEKEPIKIMATECVTNEDCSFFYLPYGEHQCPSCDHAGDDWTCANTAEVNKEYKKRVLEYFDNKPPLCETCMQNDPEEYLCQCQQGECKKIKTQ